MRSVTLAITLLWMLIPAWPTEAVAAQRAAKSTSSAQPRRHFVVSADRSATRNGHRNERAATVDRLIPDICTGC